MMESVPTLLLYIATFLIGGLIGSIGIGGVLLVPLIVYVAHAPMHVAIAVSMFCYIFTGVVGTFAYTRLGTVPIKTSWPVFAAAVPGAILGAALLTFVPARPLLLMTAAMTLFAGYSALRTPLPLGGRKQALSIPGGLALGAFTGFAAALSGTGGPAILVPLMLMLDAPLLLAVGVGQVVQLPIALLATLVNFRNGTLDLAMAGALAVSLSIGCFFGSHLAHRLPAKLLSRSAGFLFLCIGILVAINAIARDSP